MILPQVCSILPTFSSMVPTLTNWRTPDVPAQVHSQVPLLVHMLSQCVPTTNEHFLAGLMVIDFLLSLMPYSHMAPC